MWKVLGLKSWATLEHLYICFTFLGCLVSFDSIAKDNFSSIEHLHSLTGAFMYQPGPQVELVHQVKEKECQDKIERASGQPPTAESTRYSPRTTKRWGVAHVTGATTRPTKKYRRRTAQNEALTLHRVEREDQGQDGRTGWGG